MQMQRDSTKNSVQEARENFNAANEAFQAKRQEVQPLQQGRKTQSDAQRSFQQEYRDLEVRSEAELDAKVTLDSNPNSSYSGHTKYSSISYRDTDTEMV